MTRMITEGKRDFAPCAAPGSRSVMNGGYFRTRRMVFRAASGRARVEDLVVDIGARKLRESADPESERVSLEVVWALSGDTELHYREDDFAAASFVVVTGTDADDVAHWGALLVQYLDLWRLDELLDHVKNAPNATVGARAVTLAGIGAPDEFDREFFDVISAAIKDGGDVAMRTAGVWATPYSAWKEFLPLLDHVAESEAFEELRDEAGAFADEIRARAEES
jgi:hypothetical protein